MLIKDSWPKAREWLRTRKITGLAAIEMVVQEIAEPPAGASWQREACVPPLTVIHGDAHNENFLFPEVESEPAIALDWQLAAVRHIIYRIHFSSRFRFGDIAKLAAICLRIIA